MYKIISLSSVFIRQFLLPNPFSALPNGEGYNLIATAILVPVTFLVVGLFYRRGTAPALGSFLFFIFYLAHTGLIALCGAFSFSAVACILIGIAYIALLIGATIMHKNRAW